MEMFYQRPFLLLLIFNLSKTVFGQVTTTEVPLGPCPDPSELDPYCFCYESSTGLGVVLDCSAVENEDQLEAIFTTATFPSLDVYQFRLLFNEGVRYLSRNVFGQVTFQHIYISFSSVEYIGETVFLNSNSTLNHFEVTTCNLLPQGFPFSTLFLYSNLTYLDLRSTGPFGDLPRIVSNSIETLRFRGCGINYLDSQVLNDLPNLINFYLGENNISAVPPGIFDNNPKLQEVYLGYNNIIQLVQGTFRNMEQLVTVFLWNNGMSSIEPGAFFNLPNLHILYLSDNVLEYLLLSQLGVLPSLTNLYIDSNYIQILDKDIFIGSPLVNFILAGHNNLTTIEPGTFDAMKYGEMYLNNNFLTTLDEAWLGPVLRNNNSIELSYNPLECGCDMAWLILDPLWTMNLTNINAQCSDGTDIHELDPSFFTTNC